MSKLKTLIALVVFLSPMLALAAAEHSTRIHLMQPTAVAGKELKAGSYKLEWNGAGPEVRVKVKKEGKTLAIVPARQTDQATPYSSAALTRKVAGTTVLYGVDMKHSTLIFGQGSKANMG
jgi:hypothetical protein